MSEPDLWEAYLAALGKIDLEERNKVQNLATSDHVALLATKDIPNLPIEGLHVAIMAFANAKRVIAVYLDGWAHEELEQGASLIFRQPPRRLVGRHIFGESFWPEDYCSCFTGVVDQWRKFGSEELRSDAIDRLKDRLGRLSPARDPSIESSMVFTPHIWSVFSGIRKGYDSVGLGRDRDSIWE